MILKIKISFVSLLSFLLIINSCNKEDNSYPDIIFNSDLNYETIEDIEGNEYKTITIGNQTWMAENLRTTKYNDGTDITEITDNSVWTGLSNGAYCTIDNSTNKQDIKIYGLLYNWYAVNTGRLAPKGWHIPTDEEWYTLVNYLGGIQFAGAKMKEIGTTHWESPNNGANNESGFTALPSGHRDYYYGEFQYLGKYGSFWSSTPVLTFNAWIYQLSKDDDDVVRWDNSSAKEGYSVRCIKD